MKESESDNAVLNKQWDLCCKLLLLPRDGFSDFDQKRGVTVEAH